MKREVTPRQVEVLKQYMEGDLTTRAAARELEISHQQVINFIASVMKQWYLEGNIVINPFFHPLTKPLFPHEPITGEGNKNTIL